MYIGIYKYSVKGEKCTFSVFLMSGKKDRDPDYRPKSKSVTAPTTPAQTRSAQTVQQPTGSSQFYIETPVQQEVVEVETVDPPTEPESQQVSINLSDFSTSFASVVTTTVAQVSRDISRELSNTSDSESLPGAPAAPGAPVAPPK